MVEVAETINEWEEVEVEESWYTELSEARRAYGASQENFILSTSEKIASKLNKAIERGHDTVPFMIAMIMAVIADVVDFVPLIGGLIAACFNGAILLFLIGKGWFRGTRGRLWRRAIIMIFGSLIPILNVLPQSVFTVFAAWRTVKTRGEEAVRHLEKLESSTADSLAEIEAEYGDEGD